MLGLPLLAAIASQPISLRIEDAHRIASKAIDEPSGLVRSRRHPDVYWTHGDHGSAPDLFAITAAGELIGSYRIDNGRVRAFCLLPLAACLSNVEEIIMSPPPLSEGARSLVLAFEGDSNFIYALDLSDRDPWLRMIAPSWTSSEFRAAAFSYDRPLAFYGLSQGSLDVVSGSRSCGLKSP